MNKLHQLKAPFYALFSRGLGLALQFAMNIVLSRMLGAAGMGVYSLYTSWMMLFASVADMGMSPYTLRTVSVLGGKGHKKQARHFTLRVITALLITGLVMAAAVYLTADYAASWLLADASLAYVLMIAALAGVAFMIIKVLAESLKGIGQVNFALTAETAILPLGILLVIGVIYVYSWQLSVESFLLIHLVILFAVTLIILWMMLFFSRQKLPETQTDTPALFSRSLFHFWGGGLLNMWFMNMPILLLPQFASASEIGIFGVAYRLIALGTTILVTLASIFGPRFARDFANGDAHALKRGLRQSQMLSLLIYLPLLIALTLFAEPVLGFFGDEFRAGKQLLWIMVAGQLLNTATGLVGFMMHMIHQEKQEFYILVCVTVLVFILMLILGQWYGVIGIAVAYAIGIVVKNLTSLIFSLYHLNHMQTEDVKAV